MNIKNVPKKSNENPGKTLIRARLISAKTMQMKDEY